MAKGFKLRLSLPSIRICRSKKSSSLPNIPSKSQATVLTQINPKVLALSTLPKLPAAPPPARTDHPLLKLKVISFMSGCVTKLGNVHVNPLSNNKDPSSSPALPRLCNSPVSEDNEQIPLPPVSFSFSESEGGGGGRLSSDQDGGGDDNDESDGLLSSCSSFDSSSDFGYSLKTIKEARAYGNKRNKRNGKATMTTLPENEDSPSPAAAKKKTVHNQLMPCMVDGKVNESYAVMKKSEDPYDDFKKSMMEMILEKHLSESKDLEDLLMCLLSLNSKDHHAVIVEAFGEVWEELFAPKS